jgi:2-polyprenyl-3-methyl-5-hydroxy-6-metoxy-1,4-benzoquinol methylase
MPVPILPSCDNAAAYRAGTDPEAAVFDTLAEPFDRFSEIWDRIDPGFTTWLTEQLPDRATRALDLGCGAGRHSTLLADISSDVLAVDASTAMLDLARKNNPGVAITYQQRDGIDIDPATDGVFDVVMSIHTLHHLGPVEHVLPLVKSLVAPGGTAILVDIIDPGDWNKPDWHITRAFTDAENAYRASRVPADAVDILRLLLHPDWLSMTTLDTPLTRAQFHRRYRLVFPGATITDDLHPLIAAAVWQNSAEQND